MSGRVRPDLLSSWEMWKNVWEGMSRSPFICGKCLKGYVPIAFICGKCGKCLGGYVPISFHQRTFDIRRTPDSGSHLFIMLVQPREDDTFSDAIDVTTVWVGIYIRQCNTSVWTHRVLELSWCYLGQHQRLQHITA